MSERAQTLARRFEQVNGEVVATMEACPDGYLRKRTAAEGWTVAALACHVAEVHMVTADWIRAVIAGEALPPVTMALIDRNNAERAARDADCSKAEAIARLRSHGREAAELVRLLTDDELGCAAPFALFGGTDVSVETLIERILIGDPLGHLPSLRETIAVAADD